MPIAWKPKTTIQDRIAEEEARLEALRTRPMPVVEPPEPIEEPIEAPRWLPQLPEQPTEEPQRIPQYMDRLIPD